MSEAMAPITLVPISVFGTNDCCEHGLHGTAGDDPNCESVGYGLCDAVSAWSDCNRADGHIYRVDDLDPKYRQSGDTVTVMVKQEDVAFFTKAFSEGGEATKVPSPEAFEAAAKAVHLTTCDAYDFDQSCQTPYDEDDMRIAKAAVDAYLHAVKASTTSS